MKQHIKTKYENWKLSEPTVAQINRMQRLGATLVGLSVIGVAKAMGKSLVYIISRDGSIQYHGRRGREQ